MLTTNVCRPHLPIMLVKEFTLSYFVFTGPRYFYLNVWSWFKLFFPDCPSCKMRFSLAKGGCMHFNCPECGHEFCSGCSQMFDSKGVSFIRKQNHGSQNNSTVKKFYDLQLYYDFIGVYEVQELSGKGPALSPPPRLFLLSPWQLSRGASTSS